jgi:LmbE family N-acetylglucosaminyl deacetylase
MPQLGKSGTIINKTKGKSMHKIDLLSGNQKPKILCLGAHADDIEIGCGGTILKLAEECPEAHFHWVVFSAEGHRANEAKNSAESFLSNVTSKIIDIQSFRDSYFPFVGGAIKDHFFILKNNFDPDIIFTHFTKDAHQDHRLIGELTWNAFRNNLILEYEIAKYDADLGTPNFYVCINENLVQKKISKICALFKSQSGKEWFGEESFRSLMRIRGLESNSPSNYSEAFYCRKMVV